MENLPEDNALKDCSMNNAHQNQAPVALITGASRGIGATTAIAFAEAGHDVALVARNADLLAAIAERVEATGRRALVIPGDLADFQFTKSVVPRTLECFGQVDVLINNAAWREITSMRAISLESWEKTLRICLTAPAFLARWAAESMESRKSGVIINVSSCMSRQAGGFAPAYIACKGALDSLTYELASLYGPQGIRVVALNPGAIDTELSRDYVDEEGQGAQEEMHRYMDEMIMLGRQGQPAEMARLMVALAGEAGSYITGTTIVADGGLTREHLPLGMKQKLFPQEF